MKYKKIFLCVLVAIIIEIIVFNFSFILLNVNNKIQQNIQIDNGNMIVLNWEKTDYGYISALDPIIIIEDLDIDVENLCMDIEMIPNTIEGTIFYTTDEKEVFSGDKIIRVNLISGENNIKIGKNIKAIRIDIGEEKGTVLKNINIMLNKCNIDFSFSRVVAMILIYIFSVILFSIQKKSIYDNLS